MKIIIQIILIQAMKKKGKKKGKNEGRKRKRKKYEYFDKEIHSFTLIQSYRLFQITS